MRSFSKKLAFVLAAAMVVTGFAPAAQAKAAEDFSLNRTSYILYTNEDSVNMKGSKDLADGLTGNVNSYDFNLANKPADWNTAYSYKWASSKADVATVATGGVVTAKSVGYTDITCTITEKATGNVAATLTAKVQVKANADKVEIYAADGNDYDGVKVAPGTEIDFNRNMFDEAGNKTNKKGTYVTDNTKWVVSPENKGVTVNQDNGVVTVADDAKGEFTVYAYTYQSDKYNKATATSNKVVFTVGDDNFEVVQDTVTKFTVKFDKKVASVGDVTVNRLYKGFEIPVLVKKAELAKDGMSATVELYSALKNNEEYAINVPGYDVYKLTASAGDPVEVLIYVDDKCVKDASELVYINGTAVTLKYRLIDAKGVDVTDVAGGVVLFNAKEYATDGSYYVSADQMWFAKEGVEVIVTADYQSGRYENGVQVAPAKGEKLFYSVKKEATQVLGLADWKIAGEKDDWSDKKQTVPFGMPASLAVKVKLTEGDPVVATAMGSVLNGHISFQELNPEVAALSGSNVVFFKQGVARILVYFNYQDGNGNLVQLPIAEVKPEATAPKALQSMDIDKKMITLGTVNGYDEATITVSAKNNYNEKYDVTGKVTIEGVDDNSKAALVATGEKKSYEIVGDKITLYGYELQQNTPKQPATVQLTFKVKVEGKLEQTVTVLLKSRGAEGTEYIQIATEGFGKNIARTVNDKGAKSGSFTVYKYSNGVQVGTQELLPYDANNVSANAYYFKVTKDGKDVTAKLVDNNVAGKVTINFSSVDANGVVKYTDFGAGNYVFTLYKGVAVGANTIAVQQSSAAGSVTCNVGSYGNAVRVKDNLAGDTSDAAIRAAFSIKDTKGAESTATYTVQAKGATDDNMKYVFVESITFYDDVNGDKAEYKVNVGVALLKNAQ